MLSKDTVNTVEQILLDPTKGMLHYSPKPHSMSGEAFSGSLKPGDRLIVPVGVARHHTSFADLDKGPNEHTAGPELNRIECEHTGYWSRITTVTLFLPVEFRGMTPVWMFALSGNFKKSGDIAADRELVDRIERHMRAAHRQLFQMRREGDKTHYFRAPNYTAENISYRSHWTGDFKEFSGSEQVTLDNTEAAWEASFFGRVIDPIS